MNARILFGFLAPTLLSSIAITVALSAGCSKSDAPSCQQVVDHAAKLMEAEIPAEERAPMIARCEKEPASRRACALKAKTINDLAACK